MDASVVHIVAGGIAGTAGALFTSPLEIVKTRLQSSVNSWGAAGGTLSQVAVCQTGRQSIIGCVRHICREEGASALFKGLTMTVAGVLPSRAIYFGAYHNGQQLFDAVLPVGTHANVFAASSFAGFMSTTATNPIWYVKTRMQLDESPAGRPLTVWRCITDTWRSEGFLAFYKGIQASYVGIAETALQFVLYEHLKRSLVQMVRRREHHKQQQQQQQQKVSVNGADDVACCTMASAVSKSISTVVCYPHEVLRTRLRQQGAKYRGLSQSLRLIVREEGPVALYKGMLTHFVRQIPNTCIVLTVYEATVHAFRSGGLLA